MQHRTGTPMFSHVLPGTVHDKESYLVIPIACHSIFELPKW